MLTELRAATENKARLEGCLRQAGLDNLIWS